MPPAPRRSVYRARITGDEPAFPVELREPRRVERSQGRVGGREQPAVVQPRADVAAAPGREAPVEERSPEGAHLVPQRRFVHGSTFHASTKNVGRPKFPDLSASDTG